MSSAWRRLTLRSIALFYLLAILIGPVVVVCWRTFDQGAGHVWDTLTTSATIHAFEITLLVTAIAVPVNTLFGIVVGLAIVRRDFPLKGLLNAFIDLPLALSPVVVGLSLFLLYGRGGWFGDWFTANGIQILFALPAMVLATIFVSLPFVAREVIPTLREIGDEQEQAARTLGASAWQTFRRITLPSIRWAVVYGVYLGERGIAPGDTLRVEDRYTNFDLAGGYSIAIVLALMAILVLVAMTLLKPKEEAATA